MLLLKWSRWREYGKHAIVVGCTEQSCRSVPLVGLLCLLQGCALWTRRRLVHKSPCPPAHAARSVIARGVSKGSKPFCLLVSVWGLRLCIALFKEGTGHLTSPTR